MARPTSPVVRRRQLAAELRRLRIAAGLKLDEAAEAIEASAATLSRIENGVRVPRGRDVRDLLARYGVKDVSEVASLMGIAASAREPGWWEAYTEVDDEYATYIGLEAAATELLQSEFSFVPGLLQTRDYARSILRDASSLTRSKPLSDDEIAKRIEVRLRRQTLLEPSAGFFYSLITDSAVLSRMVGGLEVMNEQIDHLIQIGTQENVSIRLVPMDSGASPGLLGNFTILALPSELSDLVYVDTLAGQLFLESAEDVARHRRAFRATAAKALPEEESRELMQRLTPTT